MPVKLFLHAGMGKAGSTRIQQTLHANRAELERRGIHVPDAPNRHHVLAFIALGRSAGAPSDREGLPMGGKDQPTLEKDLAALEAALKSRRYDKVILSNEHLVRFSRGQLEAVYASLRGPGIEITTLVYLRDYASHAVSSINQNIKIGKRDLDFYLVKQKRPFTSTFLPVAEAVAGRDRLELHAFDPASFPERDIARHFLARCGVDATDLRFDQGRSNRSLCHEAILLSSALNRLYLENHGRTRFEDGYDLQAELAAIEGQPFRIPDEVYAQFLKIAHDEAAFVFQRYGLFVPIATCQPAQGPLWQQRTLDGVANLLLNLVVERDDPNAHAGGLLRALKARFSMLAR